MNQYPLSEEAARIQLDIIHNNIANTCIAYLDDDNMDGLAKARANKGIELCLAELKLYDKTFTMLDTTCYFHSGACDVSIKIDCKYQGHITIWVRSK